MAVLEQASAAPAERFSGRARLVLIVLLVAQFTLAVDFSILNVALPAIGRGLGFGLGQLQWVATAFALAAAGFTLLFGRLADLVGRRRLFLAGLALLGAASLLGGLAVDPAMLLAARLAQGLATAAVTPAGLALLTSAFPEGPSRERALGLNGALMSAGFTTGAVLGGVLTDLLSWRWAFLLNVPVVLAVLLIAPRVLAESRGARERLDLPGAFTVTAGLLALVAGLTTPALRLPGLLVGALLLAACYLIERRAAHPLVPVRILHRPTVVWGNLIGLLAFATETSLVFLLTLYLQRVLGFAPLAAGLCFAVLGLGTVTGGVTAARVIGRLGTTRALVLGGTVQALATTALLGLGEGRGWLGLLLAATFVGGVGNMLVIVGFMVTATSGLPAADQGTATGLATMTQQIGITMGTPVMSAIATAGLGASAAPAAVLHGVATAIAANAALVVVGILITAALRRR